MRRFTKLVSSFSMAAVIMASVLSPVAGFESRAEGYSYADKWDWAFDDGGRYYTKSTTGEYLSGGWKLIEDKKYYFDDAGYSNDDFHDGLENGYEVQKNADGTEKEPDKYEWHNQNGRWWYGTEDGSSYVYAVSDYAGSDGENNSGVKMIDGSMYRFDTDGYLTAEGWNSYEYTSDGQSITEWYYTEADGTLKTGWQQLGGEWYYFDKMKGYMYKSGSHPTSLSKDASSYVFFDSGAMVSNDWAKISVNLNSDTTRTVYYYADADGKAVTGWQLLGGRWFYFDSYGRLCSSFYTAKNYLVEVFVDGYYLNGIGLYVSQQCSWHQAGDKWWYGSSNYYLANRYAIIDNTLYWFDSNGYIVDEYTQTAESNNFLYWMLTIDN